MPNWHSVTKSYAKNQRRLWGILDNIWLWFLFAPSPDRGLKKNVHTMQCNRDDFATTCYPKGRYLLQKQLMQEVRVSQSQSEWTISAFGIQLSDAKIT